MPKKAQFFILGNVGGIVIDVSVLVTTAAAAVVVFVLFSPAILSSISLVHVVVLSATVASNSFEDVEDFLIRWY